MILYAITIFNTLLFSNNCSTTPEEVDNTLNPEKIKKMVVRPTNNPTMVTRKKDILKNQIKQEENKMIDNSNHNLISVYFTKNFNLWGLYKQYAEAYPLTKTNIKNSKKITISDVKNNKYSVYQNCVYDLEWYREFHDKMIGDKNWTTTIATSKSREFTKNTCKTFFDHTYVVDKSQNYFKNESQRRYKSLSMLVFYFKGILVKDSGETINYSDYKFPNISVENNDYNKYIYGMISFENLKD